MFNKYIEFNKVSSKDIVSITPYNIIFKNNRYEVSYFDCHNKLCFDTSFSNYKDALYYIIDSTGDNVFLDCLKNIHIKDVNFNSMNYNDIAKYLKENYERVEVKDHISKESIDLINAISDPENYMSTSPKNTLKIKKIFKNPEKVGIFCCKK